MTPLPGLPAQPTLELVDVIDLKWLMARDGHHVHVERLLADTVYAQECLASAAASKHEAIRNAARRIGTRLGLTPQTSS